MNKHSIYSLTQYSFFTSYLHNNPTHSRSSEPHMMFRKTFQLIQSSMYQSDIQYSANLIYNFLNAETTRPLKQRQLSWSAQLINRESSVVQPTPMGLHDPSWSSAWVMSQPSPSSFLPQSSLYYPTKG